MIEVKYNDEVFHFDMEEVTEGQLIKLKRTYGLDILGLAQGMQRGDIEALLSVYWLMQVQAGKDLLRLEAMTLDKPMKFASAVVNGLIKEQEELVAAAEKAAAAGEDPKE